MGGERDDYQRGKRPIPGTFKVQGLIDFFRTAPRQKPYSTQVRYMSHCDVPNHLQCVNVSLKVTGSIALWSIPMYRNRYPRSLISLYPSMAGTSFPAFIGQSCDDPP